MATEIRQDLFRTSSGVGHHYRPPYYFPSSNFSSVQLNPLPPNLATHTELLPLEHYCTTTGRAHDAKHVDRAVYGNNEPLYKKAQAHYGVNYNKDLHDKLQPGKWEKPLTMGCQTSETHDKFKAEPGLSQPVTHDIRGYKLANHIESGPSMDVYPTSHNISLAGREFRPNDAGVLALNDPYLTTTAKYHRRFTPKDLDGYARKDVPTYWQCEDYPKAWGHGMKHNPLPKEILLRDRPPMIDAMVFKSPTYIRRQPTMGLHVGHRGLETEYSGNYQTPSGPLCKETSSCPVENQSLQPAPSVKATYAVPQMYNTEYQNIGSRRVIVV